MSTTRWSLALVMVLAGCQEAVDEDADECQTARQQFAEQVWAPLMSTTCIACHNSQGAAKDTKLILQNTSWPGYLDANFETVKAVAAYQYEGTSLLLMKPTGRISHGGGEVVPLDSPHYEALEELVARLGEPETCTESEADAAFYTGIGQLDAPATFRRAAVALAGRVPTIDEQAFLEVNGEEGLVALLDALLDEDAFYERLKETYNDRLLTDKYLSGDDAANLLSGDAYPHRRWWDEEGYAASDAARAAGKKHGGSAIAREPLELIAQVVREGRPFSEILTADYTVVNPLSARSFGVYESAGFESDADPQEWRTAKIGGVPHAGVLTSPMLLNRFPTTETNRNRHRARKVFDIFLATDVLALAERPIDPTSIQDHNPTMFNSNCTVCHAMIDPVAGAFASWDTQGKYAPPEAGWYPDMRPPGFGKEVVPTAEQSKALQWLAKRIVEDPRFATAAVRMAWWMLTGQEPLREPAADDATIADEAEREGRRRAWLVQSAEMDAVRQQLVDADLNFKVAIKALVLSGAFRAGEASEEVLTERAHELGAIGGGHLLVPEQLARKILATTGLPWREGSGGSDMLLSKERYRLLYGGIDSDQVIDRIGSPNGLIAAIGVRMANEMACLATARDFSLPPSARRLFPTVETSFEPEDENGFGVPAAEEAIKRTIQHLHAHLLGEALPDDDPELEETWNLWVGVWREGREAVAKGDQSEGLPWPCQSTSDWWTGKKLPDAQVVDRDPRYTVRAWMAVVSYLMSDYRFLFE